MSAPEKIKLLQDVFTSWGGERCDKIRLLAESFVDCPHSIAFLIKEENEKGALSPIKYTWMGSATFRSMPDTQRVEILRKFASGTVANTQQARSIIKAAPLVAQAIQHLEEVSTFLLYIFSNLLFNELFLCTDCCFLFI